MNLIDNEGRMDIQARLGTKLPLYAKPEDCTHYLQYFYKHKTPTSDDYEVVPIMMNNSVMESVNVRKRKNEFEFDE